MRMGNKMLLALTIGFAIGPMGCALDDDEVQDDQIGETAQAATITCGGYVYQKYTRSCASGTSPAPCRTLSTPIKDGSGVPYAYYTGPCSSGKMIKRLPHYYDQYVVPTGFADPNWNLYLGINDGSGFTGTVYARAAQQPPLPDSFAAPEEGAVEFSPRAVAQNVMAFFGPYDGGPVKLQGAITTISCGGLTYNRMVSACSGGVCRTDDTPTQCSPQGGPCAYYTGACSNGHFTQRVNTKLDIFNSYWPVQWVTPYTRWHLSTPGTSSPGAVYFRTVPGPYTVDDGGDDDGAPPGDDDSSGDDGEVCNAFGSLCDSTSDCQQDACAGSNLECYYVGSPGFPQDQRCCSQTSGSPFFDCQLTP